MTDKYPQERWRRRECLDKRKFDVVTATRIAAAYRQLLYRCRWCNGWHLATGDGHVHRR